jgi:hypothetical protein
VALRSVDSTSVDIVAHLKTRIDEIEAAQQKRMAPQPTLRLALT